MERPDAAQLLERAYGDEDACNFNKGLLCCIPKQADGELANGTEYFQAGNTRPLSIVGTSNRPLANAARYRWEPIFADWVSPCQRGFLPGRSLLANVIDLEEVAMHASLSQCEAGIVLFDFAAAFPSVAHKFLRRVLQFIGLPSSALSIFDTLCYQNTCRIT